MIYIRPWQSVRSAVLLGALVLQGVPDAQAQTVDAVRPLARPAAGVIAPAALRLRTLTDAHPATEGGLLQGADAATALVVPATLAAVLAVPVASAALPDGTLITVRPPARKADVPRTRWQHMEGHTLWTRAALSALKDHGAPLVDMVPGDIRNWCPAYAANTDAQRRAFWVGYMSALAKHESTYKPWAVGGGGRWYGLSQILPATARGYRCNVGTGEALKNGAANLSCGVRIMAHTVQRDGVIHGRDRKWRGVSADWGPMRNAAKRADMANWLKRQTYCTPANATRPQARP